MHLFMPSSSLFQTLAMRMVNASMNLLVQPKPVKRKSAVTWTEKIQGRQVTHGSMQSLAGIPKQSRLEIKQRKWQRLTTLWWNIWPKMGQLLWFLNRLQKGRFHIHTNSTPKLKQSMWDYSLTIQMKLTCDRAEIVQWVIECSPIWDCDRLWLLKPDENQTSHYYIPFPSTVTCDVWIFFSQTQQQIAKMLHVGKTICTKNWKLTK